MKKAQQEILVKALKEVIQISSSLNEFLDHSEDSRFERLGKIHELAKESLRDAGVHWALRQRLEENRRRNGGKP